MMVLCDTSALSVFLRRSGAANSAIVQAVHTLIEEDRLVLSGIVRQEILSGVKFAEQFVRLENATQALPLIFAEDADHVLAAQFYNTCRSQGIQGSSIDFLICSMAFRRNQTILTTDPDFELYAQHLPIQLYPA